MKLYNTAHYGSCLIRVHIICNIGYQSTHTDERADDRSRDGWDEIFKAPTIMSSRAHLKMVISIFKTNIHPFFHRK